LFDDLPPGESLFFVAGTDKHSLKDIYYRLELRFALYAEFNFEFPVEKVVHIFGELSLADLIERMLLEDDLVENHTQRPNVSEGGHLSIQDQVGRGIVCGATSFGVAGHF
jgi:hypothetical protein